MIKDLLISDNNKIVFLITDVLGNIPNPDYVYQTPIEAARKPNIDILSTKTGEQGGITFKERNYIRSSIETIYRKQLIPLVLAHAFKLNEYDA
jgi:hypothetical protein